MSQLRIVVTFLACCAALSTAAQSPDMEIIVSDAEVGQRARMLVEYGGLNKEQADILAKEQVTRETQLYNLAVREGLVMSQDAVREELQSMWALALADADDTGRRLFEHAAASIGQSVDDFLRNPEVIAAYRRLFSAGAMRSRVVERLNLPESLSEGQENAAVNAYLAKADGGRTAPRHREQ